MNRILEADEAASEIIKEAKKECLNLQREISAEKDAVYNKHMENAQSEIESFRASEAEKSENIRRSMKKRYASQTEAMEDVYKKESSKWVKEIVSDVLSSL